MKIIERRPKGSHQVFLRRQNDSKSIFASNKDLNLQNLKRQFAFKINIIYLIENLIESQLSQIKDRFLQSRHLLCDGKNLDSKALNEEICDIHLFIILVQKTLNDFLLICLENKY